MHAADFINGAFEMLGAVLVLNHCRAVLKDRAVAGVSVLSCWMFTVWGGWNLVYYPHLGQWASFAGGCVLVAANAFYVSLLLRFRRTRA